MCLSRIQADGPQRYMESLLRARHCARLGGHSGEAGRHSLLSGVSSPAGDGQANFTGQ